MSDKDRGLYKKFHVTRTDGESHVGKNMMDVNILFWI